MESRFVVFLGYVAIIVCGVVLCWIALHDLLHLL